MNEWQAREGEEMSLREEALMLWETLSDVCGLLWSGHVMDHLQCTGRHSVAGPRTECAFRESAFREKKKNTTKQCGVLRPVQQGCAHLF